jgi:hypothetical protein
VRTLVVSDFHLGTRLRHHVLLYSEPLERLLAQLDDVDRLVLLGDIVELLEGRPGPVMEVAAPILRAIGARLGREREVVLVPGNHDARLVHDWVVRMGGALGLASIVPPDATPLLAGVVSLLAPARVRVHYPGVWLSPTVWATHGHYLDRHLLPESAFGITRGLLGRLPRDGAAPADYESAGGPSLTRFEALMTRWLPRPLAAMFEDLADLVRAATMPRVPTNLLPRDVAPLTSLLLGLQMRRASLPALARVVHRLGVSADWIIFGHVHRLGPLPGDDPLRWQGPGGRPRMANTGCWLYEPRLLHRGRPPHPYWPGGAVLIEPGQTPQALGLLDDLDAGALH